MNEVWHTVFGSTLIVAILVALVIVCVQGHVYAEAPYGPVGLWLTTANELKLLHREDDIPFDDEAAHDVVIRVDDATTYQTIDGFGAAVTGSAAYLIQQKLTPGQRVALLDDLFGDDGINLSVVRHTIGASDFSLISYTYNDTPGNRDDFDLTHFSIDLDREDVIPVLQAILAVDPDVKIMGSPWTAPAWMKARRTLHGSRLRQDKRIYNAYARYLVKYIEAFAAEGVPIYAMTVQNEPLHVTANYPSMGMTPGVQRDLIKNHLGPMLADREIATQIIAYDHNWDRPDYALTVLQDAEASRYIAGIAWHCYAGDLNVMSQVRETYPEKDVHFTECSGGEWSTSFRQNLQWNMSNLIIGATRNWSKTVLLWNLGLDPNHGPKNGGCMDCRGVVTIDPDTGDITKNVEYYVLGHASKFVRPGAVRIDTNNFPGGLENVAFRNRDGSTVLIVLNNRTRNQSFSVMWESKAFNYTIPAGSVGTFVW